MSNRFQADADFNQIIVSAIIRRSPEIDFRTANEAGIAGIDDMDVLARRRATAAFS
jgi:ribosomal protein S7